MTVSVDGLLLLTAKKGVDCFIMVQILLIRQKNVFGSGVCVMSPENIETQMILCVFLK